MKELLNSKQKHLLYKDECGDELVLFKYGEIIRNGLEKLLIYTWSSQFSKKVVCRGLASLKFETDDPLYVLDADRSNLSQIIDCDRGKRRREFGGTWFKMAEKKLAHKIFRYNPEVLRNA